MEYINELNMSLSQYINRQKNSAIRNILNILDIVDMPESKKEKFRSVVLGEINNIYNEFCKVLTYVQEHEKTNNDTGN